jgi:hypothetical protein
LNYVAQLLPHPHPSPPLEGEGVELWYRHHGINLHAGENTYSRLNPDCPLDPKPLMQLLAIRLGYPKTIAKSLVIPTSPFQGRSGFGSPPDKGELEGVLSTFRLMDNLG